MMLDHLLYITIITILFLILLETNTRFIRVMLTKTALYKNAKTETGHPLRNKSNGYIFKIFRYATTISIFLLAYSTYQQASGVSGFILFGSFLTFKIGLRFLR